MLFSHSVRTLDKHFQSDPSNWHEIEMKLEVTCSQFCLLIPSLLMLIDLTTSEEWVIEKGYHRGILHLLK
ncbi:hypothetical protein QQG55_38710 [Brugia pahangi]